MRFVRIISPEDSMFQEAMELYHQSFPSYEQRDDSAQRALFTCSEYHFDLIYDEAVWCGIILYWETPEFRYVEHFCIRPDQRNRRVGQRALALLGEKGKTILEIDPPADEISMRRRAFYERAGYRENPFQHVHPPYHCGNQGHTLVVMSYPEQLTQEEYERFALYLREKVMHLEHQGQAHRRRVRYQGTHPKHYQEKYKELQPEKYGDTVAKVLKKGNTPAGMHISICVKEILDFLQIKPGQIGLDATLGYGGHTLEMLKCLSGTGHLYALDVDPIELVKTRARLAGLGYGPERLTIEHMNFVDVDQLAARVGPFDFALADLGVSSMQIDNPDRGFSYKREGPLDLRLNPEKGLSAAERLAEVTREELQGMLLENADEPYAEEIARAVIAARKTEGAISTTTQLRVIIEKALAFLPAGGRKDAVKKSCQRVFQALRIDVNCEFEVLEAFLEKLPHVLKAGGRVAILTFHSGEDRLVKKSFKRLLGEGVYQDIAAEVIRPSAEECIMNSRARSAKLRWAVRA